MTTRKNNLKKFHVRTFFPVLSACTNSLLYHLRQPLINGFPHEQQHEDKYIVTYYNMKGNEKYQSSGSNSLNKQHFPPVPRIPSTKVLQQQRE